MMIVQLPESILLNILQLCSAQDLAALSRTCHLFYRLIKDPFLWRHLCFRDYSVVPESCGGLSCEKIYKNLLHKYGCIIGLYQTQIGPYGGLLEIRCHAGCIEGVIWEPTLDVMEPLKESIGFSVSGNRAHAKCLCIPNLHPHKCLLNLDKRKGIVTQRCSDNKGHINALRDIEQEEIIDPLSTRNLKIVFLNEVISSAGLVHKPLILPKPGDIPSDLRRKDGSFPRQIISPGLFKGTYSLHGIELILFRYKDEHEIIGYKVTGDPNVHASKISVKILLKYPVDLTVNDGNSLAAMQLMEPKSLETPLDQIPEQPFFMPYDCDSDASVELPTTCIARYHGFGQIAYEGFQRPTFSPAQVVIFNNDLIGVIWVALSSFSVYSRVQETFTSNIFSTVESCL